MSTKLDPLRIQHDFQNKILPHCNFDREKEALQEVEKLLEYLKETNAPKRGAGILRSNLKTLLTSIEHANKIQNVGTLKRPTAVIKQCIDYLDKKIVLMPEDTPNC